MSRVEDALMRLYENADLRDELTDDEADRLLRWAEAELAALDTPALDEAAFNAQVNTLMTLIKQMNRYAGRQGQVVSQGVSETPGKIAALASTLGHDASPEQVAAAGTGEPSSTIDALTTLMREQSSAQLPIQARSAADATSAIASADEPITPEPTLTPTDPLKTDFASFPDEPSASSGEVQSVPPNGHTADTPIADPSLNTSEPTMSTPPPTDAQIHTWEPYSEYDLYDDEI